MERCYAQIAFAVGHPDYRPRREGAVRAAATMYRNQDLPNLGEMSPLPQQIRSRLPVVGGHRRLVGGLLRRAPLDIEMPPHAHRDRAGVDVVLPLQLSHRVGKPRLEVGLLGGSGCLRWSGSLCLACAIAPLIPDGGRWGKSAIGAGGGEKERAPTSCLAGAEVQCVPLDGWGTRGVGGPIQLVCIDNVRATIEFRTRRNAPATVGVAPTSAGEE
jgi:hypothetical protein